MDVLHKEFEMEGTMVLVTKGLGERLVEKLGIRLLGKEEHDLKTACISCPSSDAGRIHQETGEFHCRDCGVLLSPYELCVRYFNNPEEAMQTMGEFQDWMPGKSSQEEVAENTLRSNQMPDFSEQQFALTDSGNAERFAGQHGQNVKYVYEWNKWLCWNGKRWKVGAIAEVERLGKETIRSMYKVASELEIESLRKDLVTHARNCESANRRTAMLRLAKSELPIPIEPQALDANPWLLNCENGALDLRTGRLHTHLREDFITKMVPVSFNPNAQAPTWLRFLDRIFNRDREMILFLQRLLGYCLTGDVSEQALVIFYGEGGNGKSTLLETVMNMLGLDYSAKAPRDLLMAKRNAHPTEITILHGRRLVVATETESGCRLAEAAVKESTGGDTLTGRRMREDFWQFKPTHKIVLCANHKPEVRGTDHAIWRRIVLVPFTVKIPPAERDPFLIEKLKAELPGILAWCVQGCLDWQTHGLRVPQTVIHATSEYRKEQDVLLGFIQDCCIVAPEARAKSSDLLARYHSYTDDRAMNEQRFGKMLHERGFGKKKLNGIMWRIGVGLLTDNQSC